MKPHKSLGDRLLKEQLKMFVKPTLNFVIAAKEMYCKVQLTFFWIS